MAELVLGPLLRYAGGGDATVWVETDSPADVEVRAGGESYRSRTFGVEGHHYALVRLSGLDGSRTVAYEVWLGGEKRWPPAGSPFPPSVIPPAAGEELRMVFGSCRIVAPHEPPYTLSSEEDERGLGVDALYALAGRLRKGPAEELPHLLLLLGDQVYAHKPPAATVEFLRARRKSGGTPGDAVADFEEYTRLYRDSWSEPAIRWLLSTVPSAMIFDDHEVCDDWNVSYEWLEEQRMLPWWYEQIVGGYMSYWIYQHLGNLSPEALASDELWNAVRAAEDASAVLREFAYHTHRKTEGSRWSFRRDFANARLLVMDSRGGRVLERDRRRMVDDDEWAWTQAHATGGFDHLLLGTSLPVLLSPGVHCLQAADEAVCAGAWGASAARWAEALRRTQDLEHWSSFHSSFTALTELVRSVAAGERGDPPASITFLSGDVHHAYLAEAVFDDGSVHSPVYQAVCSPFRNSLDPNKQRLQRLGWTPPGRLLGRALARLAGVPAERLDWHLTHPEPWFENQVATLELAGRRATLRLERAVMDGSSPKLEKLYEKELA